MTSNGEDEDAHLNPTDHQVRHLVDDEMRTSYINYAMSVIIGRALPEVRDGLKQCIAASCMGCMKGGTPRIDRTASQHVPLVM